MFYNLKLPPTPPLRAHEFDRYSLIIDTETVGSASTIEIIEIALGDVNGEIVFHSLVQPVFNPLPSPSRHKRFDRAEFTSAPEWKDIWPQASELIDNRLLIAYNAAFDRRAMAATCSRYRLTSPERGWRCAMDLVKRVIGTKKNITLEEACGYFGLEGGNHRARRDVEATYRLLRVVCNRLD